VGGGAQLYWNNQANQLSGPFAHQFLLSSYLLRFLLTVCNNVRQ